MKVEIKLSVEKLKNGVNFNVPPGPEVPESERRPVMDAEVAEHQLKTRGDHRVWVDAIVGSESLSFPGQQFPIAAAPLAVYQALSTAAFIVARKLEHKQMAEGEDVVS